MRDFPFLRASADTVLDGVVGMLSVDELRELERLVATAATEELMSRFLRVEASHKADGSLITEADLEMQARLLRELARRWPAYAVLGEEMGAAEQEALMRGSDSGLWVLDPLDGTANFASGIPFFGVSIALLGDGQMQGGVVYDPVRRESFRALRGGGAWLNGVPLVIDGPAPALRGAKGMVDLKRLPAELVQRFATRSPYRSQRSFGSVALDWCWLASERVQVYLHGGQKLWDYAAGSLVLAEAGGNGGLFEDYAGTRVEQLVLQPKIAIAATSTTLFEEWSGWLTAAMQGRG
mgnify:FL=1